MGRKGQIRVRTSGVVITTPLDGGPATIQDTVQCAHCQRHKIFNPETFDGDWYFCGLCGNVACADQKPCRDKCVPAEQWLENVEKGRPEDYRPIIVSSPGVSFDGT